MAKYRRKPVEVEAITFDELVQYGIENGGSVVDGVPLSFCYKDKRITHENDECYLISTQGDNLERFTPDDLLITNPDRSLSVMHKYTFGLSHDLIENG
jgi:hypothetical protein